jgi:hypothetical protein
MNVVDVLLNQFFVCVYVCVYGIYSHVVAGVVLNVAGTFGKAFDSREIDGSSVSSSSRSHMCRRTRDSLSCNTYTYIHNSRRKKKSVGEFRLFFEGQGDAASISSSITSSTDDVGLVLLTFQLYIYCLLYTHKQSCIA